MQFPGLGGTPEKRHETRHRTKVFTLTSFQGSPRLSDVSSTAVASGNSVDPRFLHGKSKVLEKRHTTNCVKDVIRRLVTIVVDAVALRAGQPLRRGRSGF